MKKLLITLMSLLSISLMAEETAYVVIKLTGKTTASETNFRIRLTEDSQFSNEYEDGKDAEILNLTPTNDNTVFLFVKVGTHKCSSIYKTAISDLPMGFQTNRVDNEYTLTFTSAEGRSLKILDKVTNSITEIEADGTYDFEVNTENCPGFMVGQNKLIEDRFIIEPTNIPEPTICHQYGNLIITGHVGEKVKVLDMDGEVAIAEQTIDTDSKVIELTSLTSGEQYQVIVGEKTMIIRVQSMVHRKSSIGKWIVVVGTTGNNPLL